MQSVLRVLDQFTPPKGRPVWILLGLAIAFALVDGGAGFFFQRSTLFSMTQLFSTLGLVALGLGFVMMLHEYDLSLAGSFALAGIVGVLTGADNPLLGVVCGVSVGAAAGLIQGCVVVWLRMSAVALTLGGLLLMLGITYVLAGGTTISYGNRAVTRWLQETMLGGVISNRGMIVVSVYILAALVFAYTRIGRDVIATGSNRVGAAVAGVNTNAVLIGVLTAGGALSALAGVLLAYSLGAGSAFGLSDVLMGATAAAIIGGVSLGGGKGRPLGIAAGTLALCLLRSGLSGFEGDPSLLDSLTGLVLLLVAIGDGTLFRQRMLEWRRALVGSGPR
jgi:ribose/xylose/arabinose/galactoside ABC-type transport system permease subunit